MKAGIIDPIETIVSLPIKDVRADPNTPRRDFAKEPLQELAASIKSTGQIHPIVVKPDGNGKYRIIAGERRYLASKMLKHEYIPAIIRDIPDEQAQIEAAAENWHRVDLNSLEKEDVIYRLYKLLKTQEAVADRLGLSQQQISSYLRARETRLRLENTGVPVNEFSTTTLDEVSRYGEDDKTTAALLRLVHGGKIPAERKALREAARVMKQARQPVRDAVMDGTIEIDDADVLNRDVEKVQEEIGKQVPDKNIKESIEVYQEQKTSRSMQSAHGSVRRAYMKGEYQRSTKGDKNIVYVEQTEFHKVYSDLSDLLFSLQIHRRVHDKENMAEWRLRGWVGIVKKHKRDDLAQFSNDMLDPIIKELRAVKQIVDSEIQSRDADMK